MKRLFVFLSLIVVFFNSHAHEDGDLLTQKLYIPEDYTTHSIEYRRDVSRDVYTTYSEMFKTLDDVEFYEITYQSDYVPVKGFLVHPHLQEGKRYPVIVYNRGGYQEWGKVDVLTMCKHIYVLARAGYIVVASQYRGCQGSYGKDECGGQDINDVLNIVKLGQSLPYAQEENCFMVGFSRGGLMTYLALKHHVPVNAAVVIAGLTDLYMFERMRPEWALILTVMVGMLGVTKKQAYDHRSAIQWADRIHVPVMLIHNVHDPLVPLEQSISMAKVLDDLQKPYSLIVYDDTNHQLDVYKDAAYGRIVEWFKKHSVECCS